MIIIHPILTNRKYLSIGVGLLAATLLVVSLIFLTEEKSNNTATTINTSQTERLHDAAAKMVFINNFHEAEGLPNDPTLHERIEHMLHIAVSQGGQRRKLYTGTVQPDSYSENLRYTPSGNIRFRSLRVDVEPLRMTYIVHIREFKGVSDVTTDCAPIHFQMDKSVICEEMDWQ